MYYLILLLAILLIGVIAKIFKVDIKTNKKFLFLIMLMLTLFLAFRGENVGLDMNNYKDFFIRITDNKLTYIVRNIDFEIGFKLYAKIISLISKNFRFFIFITSFLSMIGVYYYIKNNSKNYFASVFLFITFGYYIYNFCTLRQSLATSVLLIGFNYLKDKKNITYILLVLLATLFHKTAIVFLILLLFNYLPNLKKILPIYLIGCLALFFIKEPLIEVFTKSIYDQYIGFQDMSGSGYYMLALIFLLIVFLGFISKKININLIENKLLFFMLLVSLPFQIMATTQGLIARIVLYFIYTLLLLIPKYLESLASNKQKVLKAIFYVSLTIFYIIEVESNAMYVAYTIF